MAKKNIFHINFNQTSFSKKLAKVIVILNRASSIDKQNKKEAKILAVPAFASCS